MTGDASRPPPSELARPVSLRQITGRPYEIEANEAERAALARRFLARGIAGGNAQHLARHEPIVRLGAAAIDPDLPGARPARHGCEPDFGQVSLEPPVQPDIVIVGRDRVLTHFPSFGPALVGSLVGVCFGRRHCLEHSCNGEAEDQRADRQRNRQQHVEQRDRYLPALDQ